MMKCEHYNLKNYFCMRDGKYQNQHCPYDGSWNDCGILIGIEKSEMRQRDFDAAEEAAKKIESMQILRIKNTEPLNYDYLKGFYDGVKAVIDK